MTSCLRWCLQKVQKFSLKIYVDSAPVFQYINNAGLIYYTINFGHNSVNRKKFSAIVCATSILWRKLRFKETKVLGHIIVWLLCNAIKVYNEKYFSIAEQIQW